MRRPIMAPITSYSSSTATVSGFMGRHYSQVQRLAATYCAWRNTTLGRGGPGWGWQLRGVPFQVSSIKGSVACWTDRIRLQGREGA